MQSLGINLIGCDVLVVGAGLSGLTAARLAAEAGHKVILLEKRNELGGNTYDYMDKSGIRVQKYGPHIFHTNDKEVFEFLSRFTDWYVYEHRVLGNINDTLVPIPFNLTSLFALYPKGEAERIKEILIGEMGLNNKVPILVLKEHGNPEIKKFARFVYQNVFYKYTLKQWGFKPEELGEAVGRVPVYISYEDRYFTDKYQYMPLGGFTAMAEGMASHPNIKVILGSDGLEHIAINGENIYVDGQKFGGKLIYTGRIEELFGFKYGPLRYRSLDFKLETHDKPSYQPAAVVNYNTSKEFTRISEFSKFCCPPAQKTVIVKEYSKAFKEGDIPYYPIPKAEYRAEYERYLADAQKVKNLFLLGRLATYKYINMDIAVKNAMDLYKIFKDGIWE